MAQKRRRDNKSQKATEEHASKKKRQVIEEDAISSSEDEQPTTTTDNYDSNSEDENDANHYNNDDSSDDDDNDEYDVDQFNNDHSSDDEEVNDDEEAEEIMKFQEKHMKKIEHRMPGYHKRLQKEAQKDEGEELVVIPKLPAFDDDRTRKQFSENVARILSSKIPEKSKWPFPSAKLPVLVLAKGKAKQLINVTKETKQADRERSDKHSENELILNRNHILPSFETMGLEKDLREVATRGVVKLLNQVVQHRRRDDQEEEAVDDYAILRKFTKSGRKK